MDKLGIIMRTKTSPICTSFAVDSDAEWIPTIPSPVVVSRAAPVSSLRSESLRVPCLSVPLVVPRLPTPLVVPTAPMVSVPSIRQAAPDKLVVPLQRRRRKYGWSLQKKRNSLQDRVFTLDAILGASWNRRTQKMRLMVRWAPSSTGHVYKDSWISEDCVIGNGFCQEIARLRAKFCPI